MTAPRPRVEGEATIRQKLDALGIDPKDHDAAIHEALDRVARLAAEVERLTKEKAASGETKISAEHLDALARYARDEISTGRLAELLGVTLMDLLDLRNAVQSDAPLTTKGDGGEQA